MKLSDLADRRFLIAYLTLGYPSKQLFPELARLIADSGADLLELGIPSKLGYLDGIWIKISYWRALGSGINDLDSALELASEISHPKLLLGYYSELGDLAKSFKIISDSGWLGILIPDLGFMGARELKNYAGLCEQYDLSKVFFVQESFPEPIIHEMLKLNPDLIYLGLSYFTGTDYDRYYSDPVSRLNWIAQLAGDIPIAAGFGIKSPEQIPPLINAGARGIVIGSALVQLMEAEDKLGSVAKLELSRLIQQLKQQILRV